MIMFDTGLDHELSWKPSSVGLLSGLDVSFLLKTGAETLSWVKSAMDQRDSN